MTVQAKQAEKKFRQMDQRQPGDFEATEDMSNGMRLTKSSDWRAGAKIYLIPTLLAAWAERRKDGRRSPAVVEVL